MKVLSLGLVGLVVSGCQWSKGSDGRSTLLWSEGATLEDVGTALNDLGTIGNCAIVAKLTTRDGDTPTTLSLTVRRPISQETLLLHTYSAFDTSVTRSEGRLQLDAQYDESSGVGGSRHSYYDRVAVSTNDDGTARTLRIQRWHWDLLFWRKAVDETCGPE